MQFIIRWFNKKFNRYLNEDIVKEVYANQTIASPPKTSNLSSFGMNFTVYKANGGFIVEYHQYDRHRDRGEHKLHIITEDKDLGEELGKIISFETLRS
jgi:pyruvoyl-dependent arginine decarboxylase (PvlArgDC)